MNATEKQIGYAMHLMAEANYGTEWMNAKHSNLGATMRERSGRVSDWLRSMTRVRISALIDQLKEN